MRNQHLIERRQLIKGAATAGLGMSVAGCVDSMDSMVELDDTPTQAQAGAGDSNADRSCVEQTSLEIDQSRGERLFQRNSNEWYLSIQKYIDGLRATWTSDPEQFAENYSDRLTKLALGATNWNQKTQQKVSTVNLGSIPIGQIQ